MMKNQFILPEKGIYLCGHSLGPMPKAAHNTVKNALKNWATSGVTSWNEHHWIDLPKTIGAKIARLIGAKTSEIIVSDSTSVNLYKVVKSALAIHSDRRVILTTEDNFPADLYILQGISQFDSRYKIKTVPFYRLEHHLKEEVAVLVLSHVNYRDASIADMATLTQAAHQLGIPVVWDLSHSTGILPIALNKLHVDFAVGCTYKYLNGGPGAPAFIYVNERHHSIAKSPLYGWMGHQTPFHFEGTYKSTGIHQFMGGTPSILSLVALEGALMLYEKIELSTLFSLIQKNSSYLISALENLGLTIVSPKNAEARGGHVAFTHPKGAEIAKALCAHHIIVDYRPPHLIRLCVNPLYITLKDLDISIKTLFKVIQHATLY